MTLEQTVYESRSQHQSEGQQQQRQQGRHEARGRGDDVAVGARNDVGACVSDGEGGGENKAMGRAPSWVALLVTTGAWEHEESEVAKPVTM